MRGRGAVDGERFSHGAVEAACDEIDVLCMQEIWLAEAEEFFARRPHPHKHRDGNEVSMRPLAFGGSGLGIASRLPIAQKHHRSFRPPHVGSERFARKGLLHARIQASDEVLIDVITTHMQSGDGRAAAQVRTRQLVELRSLIDEVCSPNHTTVVCGDFNVDGHAPTQLDYRALEEAMHDFDDLGRAAGLSTFDPKENALAAREGPNAKRQRLDYVFFRAPASGPSVRATDVRLAFTEPLPGAARRLFASDHAALRVELTLL